MESRVASLVAWVVGLVGGSLLLAGLLLWPVFGAATWVVMGLLLSGELLLLYWLHRLAAVRVPGDPPMRGFVLRGEERSQRIDGQEAAVALGEGEESPRLMLLPRWLGPYWWATQTPGRILEPGLYYRNPLTTTVLGILVDVSEVILEQKFPTKDKIETPIKVKVEWRPDFFTCEYRYREVDGRRQRYRVYRRVFQFLDRRQDGESEQDRNGQVVRTLQEVVSDILRAWMARHNLMTEILRMPKILFEAEIFDRLIQAPRNPRTLLGRFLEMARDYREAWEQERRRDEADRQLLWIEERFRRNGGLSDEERNRLETDRREAQRARDRADNQLREVLDKYQAENVQELLDLIETLRSRLRTQGAPDQHSQGVLIHLINLADIDLPEEIRQELAQIVETAADLISAVEREIAAGNIDPLDLRGMSLEEAVSPEGIQELRRRGIVVPWEKQKVLLDFRAILQDRGQVFRLSGIEEDRLKQVLQAFKDIFQGQGG